MQYQDALLALAERTLRALPPASDAASSPPLGDAFRLGQLVCAGEYVAALRDALAARLLTADAAAAVEEYVLRPSPSAPFTVQPDHADGYTPAADRAAAAAAVTCLGAACLGLFVQQNWTGPPCAAELPALAALSADAAALDTDGEEAYALLSSPGLLRAARALLLDRAELLHGADATGFCAAWWAARCAAPRRTSAASPRRRPRSSAPPPAGCEPRSTASPPDRRRRPPPPTAPRPTLTARRRRRRRSWASA